MQPRSGTASQAFFAHWLAQRDDLEARYELVRGRVERSPPADARAQQVARRLHRRLARAAARCGAVVCGPGCTLALPTGDTVAIDVAVFACPRALRSRATGTHGAVVAPLARTSAVPELVIDVLPTSPALRDRSGAIERRTILAQAGVREQWVVDPRAQTVTVLVKSGDRLALVGVLRRHQSLDLEALLGIVVPVGLLFRETTVLKVAQPRAG
ncbi:MAG TPA: Uma2 family endonuclease [Nannocystaceae bacterium]|nr:Uma2 family endonuclease [Nannocystaceae bacterium]